MLFNKHVLPFLKIFSLNDYSMALYLDSCQYINSYI